MTQTLKDWWKTESVSSVSEVVSLLNDARIECDSVRSFQIFAGATNRLWTQLNRYEERNGFLPLENREKGRQDMPSFRQLLKVSLPSDEKKRIIDSLEFVRLVNLRPMVLSHDELRRLDYDPAKISPALHKKASEEHSKLDNAFCRYSTDKNEENLEKVLNKLADLLFVIRSNIAHGEKTPHGPDLNKTRRDHEVCNCARPILEAILTTIFEQPDRRLVVYGTLAPGGVNHSKLSVITGTWYDAELSGRVHEKDGLPYFVWDLSAPKISVKIFEGENMKQKWEELDRFEGQAYQRDWVLAALPEGFSVANIYAERN